MATSPELAVRSDLEHEIYGYVVEARVMTGSGVLANYVWKHAGHINDRIGYDIKAALDTLVEQGKLIDLYPRAVRPETAGMSETYYVPKREQ